MSKHPAILPSILLVAMLFLGGCGIKYYQTFKQPDGGVGEIKSATAFKLRPIDFSTLKFTDLGYESQAAMNAEFKDVPAEYLKSFSELWAVEGTAPRKVELVGADTVITDGILVEVSVSRIALNWNAWSAIPDQFFCTVTFTDMTKGEKLYTASFEINNRSGNPWVQGSAFSFPYRLSAGAYNIAWIMVKVMKFGRIEPVRY